MKVKTLLTAFLFIFCVSIADCKYDFNPAGQSLSLMITTDGAGTTTPTGSITISSDQKLSVTAIPDKGYKFSHWSLNSGEKVKIVSPLTETTDVQLLAKDAAIQAHFTLNEGIRTANLYREDFTKENCLASWASYSIGKGEALPMEANDGTTVGGKYLRIGKNTGGNDQLLLINDTSLVFDPTKLYQIRCRIRQIAGTGTVSIGITGRNASENNWINTDGPSAELALQKQHYFAVRERTLSPSWEVYTGYFEGTSTAPVITECPNPYAPGKVNANVARIRPVLLLNYAGASGICEINYLEINEVKSFTLFAETFGIGNPEGRWRNYTGSGEISLINSDEALTGNKIVRIGNNKDNDQIWWISNQAFSFNPNWLYQIRCRIRKTAGSGTFFAGVAGLTQVGGAFVNVAGTNSFSGQHYFAASNVSSFSWQEYHGYFKGYISASVPSAGSQHSDINNPGVMHSAAAAFSPLILVNYDSLSGITEIDHFLIDVIKDPGDLPKQVELPLLSLGN